MDKNKKVIICISLASVLAFIDACFYPKAFIDWNIPFYAVCIALLIISAFLFFFAFFTAREKKNPLIRALISTVIYAALLMGITPVVNNGIFGSVAPWGSVFVNTVLNFLFHIIMLVLINKATGKKLFKAAAALALVVIIGLPVSIMGTIPNFKATNFIIYDTEKNYRERIEKIEIYENTIETAVPQTEVYKIISEHLNSPLPEGKTEKKVLVLGWDGARADIFAESYPMEAVQRVLGAGGKALISYCGGKPYPEKITQATSTAPGWCTMLTGVWADKHMIEGNGIEKNNDYLSLLVSATEEELIDSSAFYFSWDGHLETYKGEIEYVKQNNLDVSFVYNEDGDDGTYNAALADISSPDCSDFIFTIIEYCDMWGHEYGFWNSNPKYQDAMKNSSDIGVALINEVEKRSTYENEDWLILITSDHGGYVRGHGGETIMERMMFIITNK